MSPKQKTILLVVFSALMSLGVIVNSLYLESQLLGIVFTLSFFVSMGFVCGKVLFDDEPLLLKTVKGWFVYAALLTVLGTFVLLLNTLSVIFSTLLIVPVAVFFWVLLVHKTRSSFYSATSGPDKKSFSIQKGQVALSILVVAFCLAAFYSLWISKTFEPKFDVWQTIPTWFFLIVGASSFFLFYMLLTRRNSWITLVLIIFLGFLFESIYYFVWYPSLYGDPLTNLGSARFVLRTGEIYARGYLLSQGFWLDLMAGRAYDTFIVQLTRMSSSDIYWIHNTIIPLLWAIIVPISLYEITCILVKKSSHVYAKTAVLAAFSGAFLIPSLVVWGAAPTPNTLAFIFLFFSLSLLLHWLQTSRRLSLTLFMLMLTATALTHPFPSIVGGVFLLVTLIIRFVKNRLLRGVLAIGSVLLYPTILGYMGGTTFQNMLNMQSLLDFEGAVLSVHMLIAGLALVFLYFRSRDTNRRIAFVLFVMWLVVLFDYYISEFGVRSLPFGAGRILTISDFLLAPFVAIGIGLLWVGTKKLARSSRMRSVMNESKRVFSQRSFLVAILSLIIALQSVVTLYKAYPVREVELAPTLYEAEAIYYINSTALRPFAVVSDTLFTNLAIALLGIDYSYEVFGVPNWDYYLQRTYLQMTRNPSLTLLKQVRDSSNLTEVYFVLSVRLQNYQEVLKAVTDLLPAERAFGDGKLYVFKYRPLPVEGLGPMISVTFDDSTSSEVQSRYRYEIREETTYNISLSGHSGYNITDYPRYWVFQSLSVDGKDSKFDNASDVNFFLLKSGLSPTSILEVRWSANELHQKIGWKEDSFKSDWRPYPKQAPYSIEPAIENDGNILTLSWGFTPGMTQLYYHAKAVNISTDDYPYVVVRWASNAPIAVVGVYYTVGDAEFFEPVVPFGGLSPQWTTTTVQLPLGKNITNIMVGIADIGYLTEPVNARFYVDYILAAG